MTVTSNPIAFINAVAKVSSQNLKFVDEMTRNENLNKNRNRKTRNCRIEFIRQQKAISDKTEQEHTRKSLKADCYAENVSECSVSSVRKKILNQKAFLISSLA